MPVQQVLLPGMREVSLQRRQRRLARRRCKRNPFRAVFDDAIQHVRIDRRQQLSVIAERVFLDLVRNARVTLALAHIERRLYADELGERGYLNRPAESVGRVQDKTSVTNAKIVCRLLLEKKK